MIILIRIIYGVVTLLGGSSGLVKIFGMEKEMIIFRNAGFSDAATKVFGLVQIIAVILLWFPKTREIGAAVLALSFIIASWVLFKNSYTTFGIVSLSFIAMALVPLFRSP
jgi:hypothetical protein